MLGCSRIQKRVEELSREKHTAYKIPAFPAAEASDASALLFACPASAAGAIKNGCEKLYPNIVVLHVESTPG
jgi:hypothetical protein